MDGQRQEFAERSRVFDDAEDGARRAVAAKAARAPDAVSTSEIDFAGHAAPDPLCAVAGYCYHFAYELMSGRAGEAVVAALQFEIGGTNSRG